MTTSSQDFGLLLIVDDNEMNLDMLSRRLERKGYTVIAVDSGAKALALVEEQRFDLVVLDIMMPEMNGLDVLKIARERHSIADLPIIMATAKDQSTDVVEAFKLGANDYVTKPLDFPVVLARIQLHLRLKRLNELKDEFLRIASHDLKNPLTVVRGSSSTLALLMQPGTNVSHDAYDLLVRIKHNAVTMQRIIEDFLDFQALSDGQLQLVLAPTDLNEMARQVVDSNSDYAASKGITLTLDLDRSLGLISADAARLGQVLQNFVGNTIKFGFVGSGAVIRTQLNGDRVRLSVVDSGPGLTEEDIGKLFIKYARLSNKPTGGEKSSGLGLAIAKQMIDLHEGEIGAFNNPDRGSTFWFELKALPVAA